MTGQLLREVRARIGFGLRLSVPYVSWRAPDRNGKSVLDVGCGKGWIMKSINRDRRLFTTGVDIFDPYLRECKEQHIYDEYVLSDVRRLPFQDKSFDMVLCLEVLEHLEKQEAMEFLHQLERIGRRQIIISTPSGTCEQEAFDGDSYQEHKSTWTAAELGSLGYKVRGFGFHGMYGDK